MDGISETQQMLANSVAAMLERHHDTDFLTEGKLAPDHWGRLSEIGLMAAELPENAGGLGMAFGELVPVMQHFGKKLATTYLVEFGIISAWILAECKAPVAETLLQATAGGDVRVALAFDEYGMGGDISYTKTTASVVDNAWELNGAKCVVVGADRATHFLVPAILQENTQSDADPEIGLFLVARGVSGLEIKELHLYDSSSAGDLHLKEISVESGNLIARGGAAVELLEGALDRGRAALCHEAVGVMEALHTLTLEYVRTRKQFGQPIGQFQTMQHRMADMTMELELARSAAQYATEGVEKNSSAAERMKSVSAAMVTICQAAKEIGESAVQAHGGIAMTREYLAGHYFKRLTMLARYLGDTEEHLSRYIRLVRH